MCKHMRLQKMYFYGQVIMSSLFKIDKCKFFTRAFIFVCLKIIGNQLFSDMTVKEKGKVNSSQASTRWDEMGLAVLFKYKAQIRLRICEL